MIIHGFGFGQKKSQFDPTRPNAANEVGRVRAVFFDPNPTRLHPEFKYRL
jgi:hypothetical protein